MRKFHHSSTILNRRLNVATKDLLKNITPLVRAAQALAEEHPVTRGPDGQLTFTREVFSRRPMRVSKKESPNHLLHRLLGEAGFPADEVLRECRHFRAASRLIGKADFTKMPSILGEAAEKLHVAEKIFQAASVAYPWLVDKGKVEPIDDKAELQSIYYPLLLRALAMELEALSKLPWGKVRTRKSQKRGRPSEPLKELFMKWWDDLAIEVTGVHRDTLGAMLHQSAFGVVIDEDSFKRERQRYAQRLKERAE
jgi:hypothetical protein